MSTYKMSTYKIKIKSFPKQKSLVWYVDSSGNVMPSYYIDTIHFPNICPCCGEISDGFLTYPISLQFPISHHKGVDLEYTLL